MTQIQREGGKERGREGEREGEGGRRREGGREKEGEGRREWRETMTRIHLLLSPPSPSLSSFLSKNFGIPQPIY
jgi:hypothetical protein